MFDQKIRAKAVRQDDKIILAIECKTLDGKWFRAGILQPAIAVSGQDTLNLDIFAPKVSWRESQKKARNIFLAGSDGVAKIKTGVFFHSHDILRVETRVSFSRAVRLEFAKDIFSLENFNIESSWTPHQTPLNEMLIGDLAFRTPALIAQDADKTLALIPNLKSLNNERKAPAAMSFSPRENEFSFGCVPYRLSKNTYFIHYDSDTADVPRATVTYSYFIYFKNGCRTGEGYRNVARRIRQLAFPTQSRNVSSQKIPFEKYSDYAAAFLTKKLKRKPPLNHLIQAAFALALSSKRKSEKIGAEICDAMDFALTSQMQNGLFKIIFENGEWKCGSPLNSLPEKLKNNCVRLADLSNICYYLCRFYNEIKKDERILNFVCKYADRLVELQKDGGHIPAWVDYATGGSRRFCAKSAEVSAHTIFLCELAKIKPEQKYISCARRAVNFIIRKIFPTGRWEDTELFYTTSPIWKHKKPKLNSQNSFSVSVAAVRSAAKAMLELYKLTSTPRYLSYGEKIIDFLCLYQQIWQPAFLKLPCFGGFAAMNTDIHWNASVQAPASKTFFDYYKQTGKSEYFIRGVAALRAAFVLMNCPENAELNSLIDTDKETEKGYIFPYCFPTLHKQKVVLPAQDFYHNATEKSLLALEETLCTYGDLFVDTKRRRAFGINGIFVNRVEVDLAGVAVYGEEFLGKARALNVRADSGIAFTAKIKKVAEFEVQV